MILHPCAKINLALELLRRREDGYHDLNSIFLPIPLADEFHVEQGERGIEFTCDTLPADDSNLCVRAARALQRHAHAESRGARITLKKNIPAGAGLGGGSSDAAATLLALNELWDLGLAAGELSSIAATLGADVPFFLNPRPALVQGIGERITPLAFPFRLHVLLVCPDLHIDTRWAYQQVRLAAPKTPTDFVAALASMKSVAEFRGVFANDFEQFVFPHHPQLQTLKETLYGAGALFATMSGSGSAMVGVFESIEQAGHARSLMGTFQTHVFDV